MSSSENAALCIHGKLVEISIINKTIIFCKVFDSNGCYFKIIWRLTITLFSQGWNLVANVDYFAFLGNFYLNELYFYIMQFQHIMWPAKWMELKSLHFAESVLTK